MHLFREFLVVLDMDTVTSKQACLHQISAHCPGMFIANGLTDGVRVPFHEEKLHFFKTFFKKPLNLFYIDNAL